VAGDRVGLGWRAELAAGIYANLDEIDLVEVIADDFARMPERALRGLKLLGRHLPLTLHGVGLGLASVSPPDAGRLQRLARLVERLQPESWSEHLAFVRAGGIEIGHLAAPPRSLAGIDATVRNIRQARSVVGMMPAMENIATLVQPPCSPLDEPTWISGIVAASGAPLLLDLHNLLANALNFGADPATMLLALPLDRVKTVHLSGGHWIAEPVWTDVAGGVQGGGRRLLDDHVHDVPAEVFDLLELLASRAPQPLDVILERDGAYPRFQVLLDQLALARGALRRGRAKANLGSASAMTVVA
jgi:hypothetical protein